MALPALAGLAAAVLPSLIGLFDKDAGATAEKAAKIVTSVVGTDDEAEARRRLEANPELMIRLREALLGFQVRVLEEETKRLEMVNATMRVEAQSDKWWVSGWRPFWGFVSALAFAFVAGLVCWLGFKAVAAGDQAAMRMIPDLVSAMALLFGIPGAILGVASWHRGKEKRIRAGERADG